MTGCCEFALAFAAFLLSHALPARPAVKGRLERALGAGGYLAAYSAVSVGALGWLIVAAGRAPYLALWAPEPWTWWVPNLAMPLVCLLIAFGGGAPNPLSFGGAHNERFDPDRPGVAGVARHPLLWALALWALAHLAPNGDLAHALLFGGFAGFALLGMRLIDRRNIRRLGAAEWARQAERTSALPCAALFAGRWTPRGAPEVWRLALALGLWASLLGLHPTVIGVSALPL